MRPFFLITLGLLLSCRSVDAALLWAADFSSYDTSSGPSGLRVDDSGLFDTFSDAVFSSCLTNTVCEVRASDSSGNSLYIEATSEGVGNTVSALLAQSALPPV